MSLSDPLDLARAAAVNNAEWCAAVWRSHGLDVEQDGGLWFCRSKTPRFYPNAVTVDPDADPTLQRARIAELAAGAAFAFSVKDSFDRLRLETAGFERAFSALWLARALPSEGTGTRRAWRAVSTADLAAWEAAWSGEGPATSPIFTAALLLDGRVSLMAQTDPDGRIIGGGAIFEAAGVAGLTNVFGDARGLLAGSWDRLSSRTVTAYEAGLSPADATRRGFRALSSLSVWTRARP